MTATPALSDGGCRIFSAPLRYVQGPGALDVVGAQVRRRHVKAAVLVDELLFARLAPRLEASMRAAGVNATVTATAGEVTQTRIDSLAADIRPTGASVVVAVGGGKTLDTGKGVARTLAIRVVTIPTIASNDGPTSRVIALYDDEHKLVDTPRIDENPEAVIVDTELLSQAPRRFLLSGIGDAIAKKFEVAACARGKGETSNGGRPLMLPSVIADACYDVLMRDGKEALASVDAGEVSAAFERVVEAVVLMSGLAFENGGLSLAHSMTRGLMALEGAERHLHGFHVAYGALVQLAHEQDDSAYIDLRGYLRSLGLPTSLRELDVKVSADTVDVLVRATLGAPHMLNCVPVPTADSLTEVIEAVEADAGATSAKPHGREHV